ncbi:MAG TPA: DUF2970 domain-containing protein [Gammaproteobacteria bacterium]|nr:DUF2970 domain-containing protein [Gammaproteobacteria bacterium]
MNEPSGDETPGFWHVVWSVLAAFFGVQSEKNYRRDTTRGRPIHYIVIGLFATVVFVLSLWGLVQLILHLNGVG